MKDGPQGDEFASRLEVVEIGLDDDGDKITSCAVVPVEGLAPSRKEKPLKLPNAARRALEALHEIVDDAGAAPPASTHIPQNVKCVTIDKWRAHAYKLGISTSDEPHALHMAFKRAFEQLVAAHRAGVWEQFVWSKSRSFLSNVCISLALEIAAVATCEASGGFRPA
jgi:hypothetical protein